MSSTGVERSVSAALNLISNSDIWYQLADFSKSSLRVHLAAATVLRAEFVRNLTGLYDGAARDAGVWLSTYQRIDSVDRGVCGIEWWKKWRKRGNQRGEVGKEKKDLGLVIDHSINEPTGQAGVIMRDAAVRSHSFYEGIGNGSGCP